MGTTRQEYEKYLVDSIHKNARTLVNANRSFVELSFVYARQGKQCEFLVKREWASSGKKLTESLSIEQDGERLGSFTFEQCQAFLSELIPLGVSELFFFDGEKIAELAEDESGDALKDALKKLVGLDLVAKLDSDLGIVVRQLSDSELPKSVMEIKKKLDIAISNSEKNKNEKLLEVDALRNQLINLTEKIDRAEEILRQKGGAWASTRHKDQELADQLVARKSALEGNIKRALGGAYPLVLVPTALKNLRERLCAERDLRTIDMRRGTVLEVLELLQNLDDDRLKGNATQAVTQHFEDLLSIRDAKNRGAKPQLDLSSSQLERVLLWIDEAIPSARRIVSETVTELNAAEEELAQTGVRLALAPNEAQIASELEDIKIHLEKRGSIRQELLAAVEQVRAAIRDSIALYRDLQKLTESAKLGDRRNNSIERASSVRTMVREFSTAVIAQRVELLEKTYIDSFRRLARKDDLLVGASIDPNTFGVTLYDHGGNELDAKQLSAGEKQIYAIAMLEALAKTSGRRLPIIIDTPLGRLDSKHREQLVNAYFPHASQQVIILSTDTEIDQEYLSALSPSISHAYHLVFDEEKASSRADMGYFWKSEYEELRDAS